MLYTYFGASNMESNILILTFKYFEWERVLQQQNKHEVSLFVKMLNQVALFLNLKANGHLSRAK